MAAFIAAFSEGVAVMVHFFAPKTPQNKETQER